MMPAHPNPERGAGLRRRSVLLSLPLLTAAPARGSEAGRRLRVGPGQALKSLAEAARVARDGALVEVEAGVYPGDVAVWPQQDLTLRAIGGRVRLPAAGRHAQGKALFVCRGAGQRIEGLDFSGARVPEGNGAGIRLEPGGSLHLRDCSFSDCQMGLLTANHPAIELTLTDCEFADAGPRPGEAPAHLLYAGAIARLAVSGCVFRGGRIGHLLKSRAARSLIAYSRLTDGRQGRASYELEFPNGGEVLLLGNLIEQGPLSENAALVAYGTEGLAGGTSPAHQLTLLHNTLIDRLPRGGIWLRAVPGLQRLCAINNLLLGGLGPLTGPPGWRLSNNPQLALDAPRAGLQGQVLPLDSSLPRLERQPRLPRGSQALTGPPQYPGALQS